MEHEYEDDAADADGLTAVKLSLVGGFVGTLAGLKRRGLGGAVVGGLVGGTAGYAAGAALDGSSTADEWDDPLGDVRDDPVTVDVGSDDDGGFDFDAGDDEGEDGADGSEAEEAPDEAAEEAETEDEADTGTEDEEAESDADGDEADEDDEVDE
jgi:hypothetical protein